MVDLNFTIPAPHPSFDAKVALKYFKAAGDTINVAAGQTIFSEHEKGNALLFKRDKMYFLVEGEVELIANNNRVGVMHGGELFGEMALIT